MCILGDDLAHETDVALEECTEGWIAVMRLAALSLCGTSDIAAFLERPRLYSDPMIFHPSIVRVCS
jgi:ATP/maltotriose-dependent transcriptional regulator MalT